MAFIERTECVCGFIFIGDGGGRPCVHRDDGREHRKITVEYVPASQLAGAVEAALHEAYLMLAMVAEETACDLPEFAASMRQYLRDRGQ